MFFSLGLHAQTRPNIIFILADDLGWGDLHCYGHPYAKTPHLDKPAAEGARFTHYYSTGVTCCPARLRERSPRTSEVGSEPMNHALWHVS